MFIVRKAVYNFLGTGFYLGTEYLILIPNTAHLGRLRSIRGLTISAQRARLEPVSHKNKNVQIG